MIQRLMGVFFGVLAVMHASSLMYVSSFSNNEVLQYSGFTGAAVNDPFATYGSGGLKDPTGLAFGPDGNLYVASWWNNTILKFNGSTGAYISTLVSGSSLLADPTGLVFGPDGNLYVASQSNGDVLEYNPTTGAYIQQFATGLSNPYGLAFDSAGNLYVANYFAGNVLEYYGPNASPGHVPGTLEATFASGLSYPYDLAFDRSGNLWVSSFGTNSSNSEVVEYSSSGTLSRIIGVTTPTGLAIGPDGNVYVASATGNDVLEYSDSDGSLIKTFVGSGSAGLSNPSFLIVDTTPEPGTFFLAGTLLAVFALRFRARRRSGRPYSGNGCPLVSGANGKAARPTRNTRHMVTPA